MNFNLKDMNIDLKNKKGLISGILSVAAGVAGLYFFNKYKGKLTNIAPADIKGDFQEQKEKVMTMIEDSRKKFSEKHTPPSKHHDKKAQIHNQNHNLKVSTKRTY